MDKPETPFPKHWRYYIFLKWVVIGIAVSERTRTRQPQARWPSAESVQPTDR